VEKQHCYTGQNKNESRALCSLDALTGIVRHDDSQISDLRLRRAYDKQRPRIELTVNKKAQCTFAQGFFSFLLRS